MNYIEEKRDIFKLEVGDLVSNSDGHLIFILKPQQIKSTYAHKKGRSLRIYSNRPYYYPELYYWFYRYKDKIKVFKAAQ